jgi:hypothetical protein
VFHCGGERGAVQAGEVEDAEDLMARYLVHSALTI